MKHFNLLLILALSLQATSVHADVIDFLFGAGKFGRKAEVTADCRHVFKRVADNRRFYKDQTWKERIVTERDPHYLNDLDYLEEWKLTNGLLGVMDTKYIKEFDTRFYFTATAKPRPDGTIPMVDPEAKALVIYFHGSGTEKASGASWAGKANALAKLGYSSLSFDLPFHKDGSRNPLLARGKDFADWVNSIVEKHRVPGQKVILIGHSFGPDAISEVIQHHPHITDTPLLISPANLDKVSRKWYNEKTSKMDFGDTRPNVMGGNWAGQLGNSNIWNKPKMPGWQDPTIANPNMRLRVVSGELEEYFPGSLGPDGKPDKTPRNYDVEAVYRKLYRGNVSVKVEKGVGHYIFAHQDEHGHDVIMREVLAANGESLANEKEIKKEISARLAARPQQELLATRYSKDLFFKKWFDLEAKKQGMTGQALVVKLLTDGDRKTSQNMLNTFNIVDKQRMEAMFNNIKNTQNWAPEFYKENQAAIDQLGTKGFDPLSIQTKYLNFLRNQPEEKLIAHASVSESVFVVPEKPKFPRPDQASDGQQVERAPKQKQKQKPNTNDNSQQKKDE